MQTHRINPWTFYYTNKYVTTIANTVTPTLCNIKIPTEITVIGSDCFASFPLHSYSNYYYSNPLSIYMNRYEGTAPNGYGLKSIVISKNVEKIGDRAFIYCNQLSKVEFLTSKIQELQKETFKGCYSLESITIPSSVIKVGDSCFEDCTKLNDISILGDNITFGNACFKNCDKLSGNMANIILSAAQSVGDYCFYTKNPQNTLDLVVFDNIMIPRRIKKISNSCFEGRSSLKSVTIAANEIELGDACFKGCDLSEDAINAILKKATKLGKECFSKMGASNTSKTLRTITIPENITYIPEGCFKDSTNLEQVNIQSKNIIFGKDCFSGCSNLTFINIPNINTFHGKVELQDGCFSGCPNLSVASIKSISERTSNNTLSNNILIEVNPEVFETDKIRAKRELDRLIGNATKIQKSYVESTDFSGYTARSIVQGANTQLVELLKQLSALKDSL